MDLCVWWMPMPLCLLPRIPNSNSNKLFCKRVHAFWDVAQKTTGCTDVGCTFVLGFLGEIVWPVSDVIARVYITRVIDHCNWPVLQQSCSGVVCLYCICQSFAGSYDDVCTYSCIDGVVRWGLLVDNDSAAYPPLYSQAVVRNFSWILWAGMSRCSDCRMEIQLSSGNPAQFCSNAVCWRLSGILKYTFLSIGLCSETEFQEARAWTNWWSLSDLTSVYRSVTHTYRRVHAQATDNGSVLQFSPSCDAVINNFELTHVRIWCQAWEFWHCVCHSGGPLLECLMLRNDRLVHLELKSYSFDNLIWVARERKMLCRVLSGL